ncbi:MAG: phosphate ABC transporter permease subunit PstC, partial [Cyanobacteria bacterium M_surface_10_m1_298]|nr:phosphate ABC transporter permease subunit PstC [Cyanobacteria bacterium M_surface_10_m1_298]
MARSPRLELFALRRRSVTERVLDRSFLQLAVGLAATVGLLVLAILLTVLSGAWEAIRTFGLSFITTSDWDPGSDHYGA